MVLIFFYYRRLVNIAKSVNMNMVMQGVWAREDSKKNKKERERKKECVWSLIKWCTSLSIGMHEQKFDYVLDYLGRNDGIVTKTNKKKKQTFPVFHHSAVAHITHQHLR